MDEYQDEDLGNCRTRADLCEWSEELMYPDGELSPTIWVCITHDYTNGQPIRG